MTPQNTNVSVIDPIGPAFNRVKTILFQPFDLGKWLVIGFCAWLADLTRPHGGGGGGGGRGGTSWNVSWRQDSYHFDFDHIIDEVKEAFYHAKDFALDNLHWIIPVGLIVLMVSIVLWLVLTWLSSRGRFMFLHCVAQNKAEVKVPWNTFRRHANSLFLFRIVLDLISFGVMFTIGLIVCFLVFVGGIGGAFGLVPLVLILVITIPLLIVIGIVFLLVYKFTTDFVIPIMFLRTTSCMAAWREFLKMLSANKARFLLYILFQIVIALAIGFIIVALICATCCCACCILAIPYIGTVLLLPVLVFKRSYSLLYLRQFGPTFDVFIPEPVTAQ